MANYEDDDIDEIEENGMPEDEIGAEKPAKGNRNFLVALGVLGAIFVVAIAVLLFLIFVRPPATNPAAAGILATNQAILMANTQTVSAATLNAGQQTVNGTPQPGEAAQTQAAAQGAVSGSSTPLSGQVLTATPNMQTRTATIGALLTQTVQVTPGTAAAKTATPLSNTTATATRTATQLPTTGFADEVGLPGLFGLALGLLLVIILVRRLRFSSNG